MKTFILVLLCVHGACAAELELRIANYYGAPVRFDTGTNGVKYTVPVGLHTLRLPEGAYTLREVDIDLGVPITLEATAGGAYVVQFYKEAGAVGFNVRPATSGFKWFWAGAGLAIFMGVWAWGRRFTTKTLSEA